MNQILGPSETRRRIVTSYVNPPIPFRGCDWAAFYDGEEELGGCGYGSTEAEAIQDLLNQDEEDR